MSAEYTYGVSLLDELHNYFPELLYNHSRFSSVNDVLQYIHNMSISRFNLFTYNRNRYIHHQQAQMNGVINQYQPNIPHAWNVSQNQELLFHGARNINSRFPISTIPIQYPGPNITPIQTIQESAPVYLQSSLRRARNAIRANNVRRQSSIIEEQEMNRYAGVLTSDIIRSVSDILRETELSGSVPRVHRTTMTEFLAPVIIRPSTDQIDNSTVICLLTESESPVICTICQESMVAGTSIRKILHCNHVFHVGCIDTWMTNNTRCPVCRYDIRDYQLHDTYDIDDDEIDGDVVEQTDVNVTTSAWTYNDTDVDMDTSS